MKILAIETSCDETGVCALEAKGGLENPSFFVLSNALYSQEKKHSKYGGVFPSLAKREHEKKLIPLLKKVMEESGLIAPRIEVLKSKDAKNLKNLKEAEKILFREHELLSRFIKFVPSIKRPALDAVAATVGPGLEPALWVGVNLAKALAIVWNLPLLPINHMEGHIFSAFAKSGKEFSISGSLFLKLPMLALLVSGGHTELVLSQKFMKYKIIGRTRDDAAGEAFDKAARMLGLPYPGGPRIAALAAQARSVPAARRPVSEPEPGVHFRLPRPMIYSGDYDFSFAGLKTASLYALKKIPRLTRRTKMEFAKEFEDAATDVLVAKTIKAAKKYGVGTIILSGGVAANARLRKTLKKAINKKMPGAQFLTPSTELCTDNAAMIALAAYFRALKDKNLPLRTPNGIRSLSANGNLALNGSITKRAFQA